MKMIPVLFEFEVQDFDADDHVFVVFMREDDPTTYIIVKVKIEGTDLWTIEQDEADIHDVIEFLTTTSQCTVTGIETMIHPNVQEIINDFLESGIPEEAL